MSYQNIVLVYSLYSMIGSPRVCFASKARFTRAVSTHAALLAHARLLWFGATWKTDRFGSRQSRSRLIFGGTPTDGQTGHRSQHLQKPTHGCPARTLRQHNPQPLPCVQRVQPIQGTELTTFDFGFYDMNFCMSFSVDNYMYVNGLKRCQTVTPVVD